MTALGKCWCPDHFVCANPQCGIKLLDIGFVEEGGFLYCEKDYAEHFAPHCDKCGLPIIGVSECGPQNPETGNLTAKMILGSNLPSPHIPQHSLKIKLKKKNVKVLNVQWETTHFV